MSINGHFVINCWLKVFTNNTCMYIQCIYISKMCVHSCFLCVILESVYVTLCFRVRIFFFVNSKWIWFGSIYVLNFCILPLIEDGLTAWTLKIELRVRLLTHTEIVGIEFISGFKHRYMLSFSMDISFSLFFFRE